MQRNTFPSDRWSPLARTGASLAGILLLAACASTPQHRSTGEVVDDLSIHTRVKASLIDDPRVDANEVNVEVERGVVTLLGWVSDSGERRAAARIAASVEGVRSVDNQLRLKSELE